MSNGNSSSHSEKVRSIGVFNISGEYFAVRNVCPHQQAPLCEGR